MHKVDKLRLNVRRCSVDEVEAKLSGLPLPFISVQACSPVKAIWQSIRVVPVVTPDNEALVSETVALSKVRSSQQQTHRESHRQVMDTVKIIWKATRFIDSSLQLA